MLILWLKRRLPDRHSRESGFHREIPYGFMEKRAPRKRENAKSGTAHTGEPPTATPTCAGVQPEAPSAEPLRVAIIGT